MPFSSPREGDDAGGISDLFPVVGSESVAMVVFSVPVEESLVSTFSGEVDASLCVFSASGKLDDASFWLLGVSGNV